MKNRKNRKGFTLVELVVVIAIIAILGAVSVVGYLGFVENAKVSAAETEATQARTVLIAGAADPDSGFTLDSTKGLIVTATHTPTGKDGAPEVANDAKVLSYYYMTMTETQNVTFVACNNAGTEDTDENGEVSHLIFSASNEKQVVISFLDETLKVL